jgi:hypothetical protein
MSQPRKPSSALLASDTHEDAVFGSGGGFDAELGAGRSMRARVRRGDGAERAGRHGGRLQL